MTNEERENAIRILQDAKDGYKEYLTDEVLDVAIEGLKQEPCEYAINRESVLKIYNEWFATCNIADKKESPKSKIKALPPVAPKQKTGHWINGDEKCPYCGKSKFEGLDADIYADWRPKYCPNCGAKMQEVEE